MLNIDDALQQAQQLLARQLTQVRNGYIIGVRPQMQQAHQAVVQTLERVEQEGRGNAVAVHAWRARMALEAAHGSDALQVAMASTTTVDEYDRQVQQAQNHLQNARQHSTLDALSNPYAPMMDGRKDWTLEQWQQQDPNGLVKMGNTYPLAYRKLVSSATTAAPRVVAGASEDEQKTVIEQLPRLRAIVALVLKLSGQSLDELQPDRITGDAKQMLQREKAIAELLAEAKDIVPPGRVAVFVYKAHDTMQELVDSPSNVVRRLANREGGVELDMYAHYADALRSLGSTMNDVLLAAEETSTETIIFPAGRKDWTFQDWIEKDEKGFLALRDNNPALYKKLFRERFGKEPIL